MNSINWNLIIGLISLLLTIIGILKSKSKKKIKNIKLADIGLIPLISKPEGYKDDISIILNQTEIESLNKIYIILSNIGNQTLNSFDFHILPTFTINGYARIIEVEMVTSNEYTDATLEKQDSKIVISINEFEPNDFVKIELVFECIEDDYHPIFEVCIKEKKKIEYEFNMQFLSAEKYDSLRWATYTLFMVSAFSAISIHFLSKYIIDYLLVNVSKHYFESIIIIVPFIFGFLLFIFMFSKMMRYRSECYKIKHWYNYKKF